MKELAFIGISFILGVICIKYIKTYDKYEQEPFFRMFAVVCWGGVWSIVIATLLYHFVAHLGLDELTNAFGALFVIGPVEELAKLLAFLSGTFIIREEMNEPVDGIIYMSCVALGFSLIENYFYAMAPDSEHLLFFRLFISTPMHICFSAFMGLAAYIVHKNRKAFRNKSQLISKKKKIAAFELEALDLTLNALNRSIIVQMENKWWFPRNLMILQNRDQIFDYKQVALDGGAAFWRWLIYPFSADKAKKLHALPTSKPLWNWGAFIIPEFWYLYHEIWGIFFLVAGLYAVLIYLGLHHHLILFSHKTLLILATVHLLSGKFGNDIFYVMHGKWPIASWNRAAQRSAGE